MFVLTATVVLWWFMVGDVHTAFFDPLSAPAHLALAITLIVGVALLSVGLALRTLLASEPLPKSRSQAKLALTCITLAVLTALTPFAMIRGRG
jgi:hypothetical protein